MSVLAITAAWTLLAGVSAMLLFALGRASARGDRELSVTALAQRARDGALQRGPNGRPTSTPASLDTPTEVY